MSARLRIGLTQRVDEIAGYHERRDALDQNWGRLIAALGHIPMPLCNALDDPQDYINAMAPDAFVLTGGNDVARLHGAVKPAPERDSLEEAVIDYARRNRLPLMATCRGLQMLNLAMGGRLVRVSGHVGLDHGLTSTVNGIATVNSFHDWAIPADGLAAELAVVAAAPDGTIEAVRHRQLPWMGVMWHPERRNAEPTRQAALVAAVVEGRWQAEETI